MSCPITMRSLENADPFPAYEALRERGEVVWDDSLKGWLVLDFELCRHVEFNEATQFRNMYADADPLIVELKGGAANITVSQGEQHQRMRRFHMSLLSPKALQSYRDNIVTPIIQSMLDRVLAKGGSADLAADSATRFRRESSALCSACRGRTKRWSARPCISTKRS